MTSRNFEWNGHPELQAEKTNPAVKRLDVLLGEWNMFATHPFFPEGVHGRTSFEWLQENALLLWRSSFDPPEPPNAPPSSISVIGYDDSADTYSMLYFDDRGVSRIYGVSWEGDLWKMWREAPGFSQRFTGTFSSDGNTITGYWETSEDGLNWVRDLELTLTKAR